MKFSKSFSHNLLLKQLNEAAFPIVSMIIMDNLLTEADRWP